MPLDDRRGVANSRRLDISRAALDRSDNTAADPYLAAWLNVLDPAHAQPRIESGIVVDVVPGGYAYRVSAGRRSFLWCASGGTTSAFGSLGARQLTTYPIGTPVYFIRHHQTPGIGTIVAAEPPSMLGAPDQWPADGIWPFIRSGQKAEPAHAWSINEDARIAAARPRPLGGLDTVDFSAGRPMDATSAGEWGLMTETGVGLFVDSWQAYLRVDEATGVFAFYPDQMLRVAGHNYQFSSSQTEIEHLDDEGEFSGTTRTAIYPWEAYGLWRFNQVSPSWCISPVPNYGLGGGQGTLPVDPYNVQAAGGFAVREPESPYALPAARLYEWSGYLGQGGRSEIAVPVQLGWAYPELPTTSVRNAAVTANSDPNGPPGGRLVVQGSAGGSQPFLIYETGTWDLASGTFAPTIGNPAGDGVGVGLWASIFTGTDAPGGFLVRIIASDATTFTVSAKVYEGQPAATGPARAVIWGSVQPYAVPVNARYGVDQPGVLVEQKTLAGRYYLAASGGIIFAKRSVLPVPRPLRKAEDPAGDTSLNYAASGIDATTGFVTHAVRAALTPLNGPPHRVCMIPDAIAYALNWEGLHPFAYHTNDWFVAEEGEAGSTLVNQIAPCYGDLACNDYLDTPPPAYLDIDHRYGLTPVYQNEAFFGILEDGSIGFRDGWGSEMRFTGGNVEVHTPGDFRVFTGRNYITWSGHDISFKAHDSIDLVAESNDFRTSAGRNHHHLAGNSGYGGFLFEAKSVCPSYAFCDKLGEAVTGSGFVVLAPYSQVWLQGQDIVASLDPTSTDGRIVLYSGDTNDIHVLAKTLVEHFPATGAIVQLFDGTSANELTAGYSLFGGNIYNRGKIITTGGVGGLDPGIADRETYLTTTYAGRFQKSIYTPPGSECAEFSYRTSSQYLSTTFAFWQSAWQSIAFGAGQSLPVWVEPTVVGLVSGQQTRPHPGERWTDTQSYNAHTYLLVDPTANWLAVSRTDNRATYEDPITLTPYRNSLAAAYTIPFVEQPICMPSPPPVPPVPPSGCCGYDNGGPLSPSLTIRLADGTTGTMRPGNGIGWIYPKSVQEAVVVACNPATNMVTLDYYHDDDLVYSCEQPLLGCSPFMAAFNIGGACPSAAPYLDPGIITITGPSP